MRLAIPPRFVGQSPGNPQVFPKYRPSDAWLDARIFFMAALNGALEI
ncbi:MAG TPA: hypothetical protein VKB88_35335 [Bryobacteraceae bacterium]|nr:hypothetical protein [Bryobacteraceae bacterium]